MGAHGGAAGARNRSQLFGGLGVVHGVTVERLYREIRALRIHEGASEVLKLIIGAQTLKQGSTHAGDAR